jgi:hypothetical protein
MISSRLILALGAVAILAGCAHPITIDPAPTTASTRTEGTLVPKKVAYVMTDADRGRQVTTPGGGGDKISYQPYRDLEKSLRETLRSIYTDVTVVKSIDDPQIKSSGVAYVFTPVIETTSSSPSPFTWPPTKFSVDYACTVTDPSGGVIAKLKSSGEGQAEFDEFKKDFALSARRASAAAADKLRADILANEKLR